MASLLALKPFIPSGADFEKASAFFTALGFEQLWSTGDYAEFRLGNAAFILQRFNDRRVQENLMMFVAVDDLDEWYSHMVASGIAETYGVALKAPEMYPWGQREVHLIDPAGICWHFA